MKKRELLKQAEAVLLQTKKVTDFMAVVGVFYILLFRIPSLRAIGRAVCQYLITWYIPVDMAVLKKIYLCGEQVFRLAILLWFFLTLLLFFSSLIWDYRLKRQKGNNRFEESLFRYLQDRAVPRSFLITGKWGSGKTYEVEHFFDRYYRHSRTKVYRISCFGLSSRKELVEEINHTIEQDDASIYALIIKVLQFLPVVGEAVNKFLKKSYTYTSVRKGSIFIFDDFERITSRIIIGEHTGQLYRPSLHIRSNVSNMREFDEIKREFQSVENAFAKLEGFVEQNALREDYDKYIAATGLINELVESFGMKAIIVCNSDILGEKFVHDILRSKLSCVEYKKVINTEVQLSVLDQMLESKIYDDEKKKNCIETYLTGVRDEIDHIVQTTEFKDMRLFLGLLEAFMDTAALFAREALTVDFLNALFNSILVTHLCYYQKDVSSLALFVNGANLELLLRLFGSPGGMPALIRVHDSVEEPKWVDVKVSGYWIFNLSVPDETAAIHEAWKRYRYAALEEKLLKDPRDLEGEDDYKLMHVLYGQKMLGRGENVQLVCKSGVEPALQEYDLSKIEAVQEILDLMSRAFGNQIYSSFQNNLFEILCAGHAVGRVNGNGYLYSTYNDLLDKKNVPKDPSGRGNADAGEQTV